jgi:alanine dehydrogenase
MKIKAFSAEDIRRALSMNEAIEVIQDAFAQLSDKKTQSPVRTSLKVSEREDAALVMPAFLERTRALGAKLVTVFPRNPERGLPATQALVLLVDAEMGAPLAIYEGTYLTRLRTGAATGAATQALARPDARVLALFGAGGQALFQVRGVLAVRRIEEIRIYDPRPERMAVLSEDLKGLAGSREAKIVKTSSSSQAVMGADILVTATTSNTPVFRGDLLSPGAHINAIGAFKPEMQEVDEETILRSRIFVDSVEACLEEAGDLIIPFKKGRIHREDIQGELGELVLGRKAGRRTPDEITYFKSVGNAVQDISVALAIFQKAKDRGLGQEILL